MMAKACACYDDGPCSEPVVEVMVHLNPLCGGQDNGEFPLCQRHLDTYLRDSLMT